MRSTAPSPPAAVDAPVAATAAPPETWTISSAGAPAPPPPQGSMPSAWPDEAYRGWSGL